MKIVCDQRARPLPIQRMLTELVALTPQSSTMFQNIAIVHPKICDIVQPVLTDIRDIIQNRFANQDGPALEKLFDRLTRSMSDACLTADILGMLRVTRATSDMSTYIYGQAF